MIFDPMNVVVVPFPFTDRRATKRRPALVLSTRRFNEHGQLILAMITSAREKWPSDTAIRDWRQAGLVVPCRCRLKLFTLDQSLVQRRLGTLTDHDGTAVSLAVSRCLAA